METSEWTLQEKQLLNIIHDLRTPLTSVKGYLELIKSGCVEYGSDEYWRFISIIEKCVKQVETLTNDILKSQKMGDATAKLNLTQVSVDALMEEIKAQVAPILSVRHQKLVLNSSCNGLMVEADRLKLTQVIMNLLSNASKYSPPESIIEVQLERDVHHLVFSIKDYGIGIREEDLSKLIKPFPDIEVEGTFNRTGLGLSITKGIIELHNGEIIAESEGPGKGTKFWFTIPIKS